MTWAGPSAASSARTPVQSVSPNRSTTRAAPLLIRATRVTSATGRLPVSASSAARGSSLATQNPPGALRRERSSRTTSSRSAVLAAASSAGMYARLTTTSRASVTTSGSAAVRSSTTVASPSTRYSARPPDTRSTATIADGLIELAVSQVSRCSSVTCSIASASTVVRERRPESADDRPSRASPSRRAYHATPCRQIDSVPGMPAPSTTTAAVGTNPTKSSLGDRRPSAPWPCSPAPPDPQHGGEHDGRPHGSSSPSSRARVTAWRRLTTSSLE